MIDKDALLSVVKQCRLLAVSRSSVYYQARPQSRWLQAEARTVLK